eukprot:CAMPEP_0174263928 /NCGR_PEP_ID=MMETSP0439-20130205/20635_1 /TAXON_ID=0 /ORGANISM="Stereomyxa ramosa, Strain Chinc5" /LENGTH=748 /DNA_ID=CAMNT_0015349561 /DNA_START=275 /DNA_END=2518 /DNA_ORIENTATION=-
MSLRKTISLSDLQKSKSGNTPPDSPNKEKSSEVVDKEEQQDNTTRVAPFVDSLSSASSCTSADPPSDQSSGLVDSENQLEGTQQTDCEELQEEEFCSNEKTTTPVQKCPSASAIVRPTQKKLVFDLTRNNSLPVLERHNEGTMWTNQKRDTTERKRPGLMASRIGRVRSTETNDSNMEPPSLPPPELTVEQSSPQRRSIGNADIRKSLDQVLARKAKQGGVSQLLNARLSQIDSTNLAHSAPSLPRVPPPLPPCPEDLGIQEITFPESRFESKSCIMTRPAKGLSPDSGSSTVILGTRSGWKRGASERVINNAAPRSQSAVFRSTPVKTTLTKLYIPPSKQTKEKMWSGKKTLDVDSSSVDLNAKIILSILWEDRELSKTFNVKLNTTPRTLLILFKKFCSSVKVDIDGIEDYAFFFKDKEEIGRLDPTASLRILGVDEMAKNGRPVLLFKKVKERIQMIVDWQSDPLYLEESTSTTIKSLLKRVFRENGNLEGNVAQYCIVFPDNKESPLVSSWTLGSLGLPSEPLLEFMAKPVAVKPEKIKEKKKGEKEVEEMWFGIDPSDFPDHKWVDDNGYRVPVFLQKLRQLLYQDNGITQEGVFRLAGQETELIELKENLSADVEACTTENQNNAATLIKRWFGSIPKKFFHFLPKGFLEECSENEQICHTLPANLPEPYQCLFLWLCDILVECALHSDVNKMKPQNLAICVAPNLIGDDANPLESLMLCEKATDVLTKYIQIKLAERKREE